MPNATVRANTRTLPSDRRTFLRTALAAGALTTVPAAQALASPDHPDAALLALRPEIEAADRALTQCWREYNAAQDAFVDSEEPVLPPRTVTIGMLFAAIKSERRDIVDLHAAEERAYEDVLAARRADDERRWRETGGAALKEATDAASHVYYALLGKLINTPAQTLGGLIFKARYASAQSENEYDESVMESIVDDLLALGEEAANG